MKFMHVTFSNGETYKIPRSVIAEHMACLSADRATEKWDEMFTSAMYDDEVAINWARKMAWSDIEYFSILINQPALIDYDKEWPNVKVMCFDA